MSGWNSTKLEDLFVAYRDSMPDREPSAGFTPELWRKIDQRRGVTFSLGRFAKRFVTAALALCFAMSISVWTPSTNPAYSATYIDVLSEAQQHETEVVGESL